VLDKRLTVDGHLTLIAQVTHQVPVDAAVVRAARVVVRLAQRQMDGAHDLLVVEGAEGRPRDVRVGAYPQLAEEARARVGRELLIEQLLTARGRRRHDLARYEGQR